MWGRCGLGLAESGLQACCGGAGGGAAIEEMGEDAGLNALIRVALKKAAG
jgi:hypothetical protein